MPPVSILNKKIFLFLAVVLSITLADRIFTDRDLYADGSCMFLFSYFNAFTHQPLFSRIDAIMFLHLPSIIASGLGVADIGVLRFLWKIGYAVPFFISALSISCLSIKYRIFGFLYLIFSISLFYLPNSMFAVGEYQIIFAIIPALIASLKEFLIKHTKSAAIIFIACLLFLAKTYEIAAIFSLFVGSSLIIADLIKKYRNEEGIFNLLELSIILLIFLYISFNVFADFRYMPEWLKENSAKGFTYYLTWEIYGALWDTFIEFQIIISIGFLIAFFFVSERMNYNCRILQYLIFLLCLASLLANHQPEHSYTSKTFFLFNYLAISYIFIFIKISSTGIENGLKLIAPVLCAAIIFLVVQGFGFHNYMEGIRVFVLNKNAKVNVNTVDLEYFKQGFGRKYSWTWGQACISYLYSHQGPLVVGEFDREYSPIQIKNIINLNEKSR